MPHPSPAAWLLAAALCAAAAVTDWRRDRIPNLLTLPATAVGLLFNIRLPGLGDLGALYYPLGVRESAVGAALGFGVMLCVAIASQGGGGDVKLSAALGSLLGPYSVFEVLGVTCLTAFVCTFAYLVFRRGVFAASRDLIRRRAARHNQPRSGPVVDLAAEPVRTPLGPFFLVGTIVVALVTVHP